jgi:cytochrome c peroxidase
MMNHPKTLLWSMLLSAALLTSGQTTSAGLETLQTRPADWSEAELALINSLWIGNLPAPPPDPSNAYADDERAAALGERLFFDKRLSGNGEVACATCHQPQRNFTDGLARARGVGVNQHKTMTLSGAVYSPWLFWDGRKDSLWSQALGPLENPLEHGGNRLQYACLLAGDAQYRQTYQTIFARLPKFLERYCNSDDTKTVDQLLAYQRETVTRIFVNIGKAIAAYERRLLPQPTRFDRYVEAWMQHDQAALATTLNADEIAGLKLFIGKAQCVRCHNGPLFTNNEFHNTGVPTPDDLPVHNGRRDGLVKLFEDEFNCLGFYSDASPDDCAELRFARTGPQLQGAFKTPTLSNIALTPPYMHSGQFATLDEVLQHYNRATSVESGHNELEPLRLSDRERDQLKAFLYSLVRTPVNEYLQAYEIGPATR